MCNCKWGGCSWSKISKIVLFIGGLNWGLTGLGMLLDTNLNVLNLVLGSWPVLEAIVYILVGVAAVMRISGCHCRKCKAACASCSCSTGSSMGPVDTSM